jgi:hypothetical protein
MERQKVEGLKMNEITALFLWIFRFKDGLGNRLNIKEIIELLEHFGKEDRKCN